MKSSVLAMALGVTFGLSGCATIVSNDQYPVTLNSSPSGATVTITNENGMDIQRAVTPFTTTLSASDGYFDAMDYTARFDLPCHESKEIPLDTSLDPWYWGNLLFGGLIGLFIVDPATGAMYEIDPHYSLALNPKEGVDCRGNEAREVSLRARPVEMGHPGTRPRS